jgi:protein phosphatase
MNGSDDGKKETRPGIPPFLDAQDYPPLSATTEVVFGAHSVRGRSRAINEDHYLVFRMRRSQETLLTSLPETALTPRFEEYGYAMVVADGVGDAGRGEMTSRLAIATLVHLVRHFGKWNLRVDDEIAQELMARADRFYRHVDNAVVAQRETAGVDQTTLTATFNAGRDLFFAHVGHSRAYLCRNGRLLRLTRDHTLGLQDVTSVPIAPLVDVNAAARDLRHVLTNTIGMSGPYGPTIDLERIQLEDDDRVLVCTNGLTDAVEEEMIRQVLETDHPPDVQAHAVVELAVAARADDDVTALVARYHIPG